MDKQDKYERNITFLFKETWHSHKSLYAFFVLNIVLMLVFTVANIVTPRYLIQEITGSKQIINIIKILGIYFVLTAATGYLMAYIKNFYKMSIIKIRYGLMERTKEKIMRVQYKTLEDPAKLNDFWRVVTATDDNELGVMGILVQAFVLSANAVCVVFLLGIISLLNFWLAIFLAFSILIVFICRNAASKYQVKHSRKRSVYERRERYLSNVMGDFTYGKDIRVYGLSNFILEKLKENNEPRRLINKEIQNKNYLADIVESILSCARDAVVYGYLIFNVLDGSISIAYFSMYFLSVASLTVTLQKVFEDVAYIKGEMFRVTEMRKFLSIPNETDQATATTPIAVADAYKIEFVNVSFKYPGSDQYIFESFNFTINANKKLAIVGINGAGKTTLVKLITRLYEPTAGEILLNGTNIQHFGLIEYRELLTAVFQDINIFAMSLKENITCSQNEYDHERFIYAIANSGFQSAFEKLDKGADTQLTKYLHDDGIELSGGEKQKIGIARALYRNAKVMIFDEPTAALDAYAEYNLYNKLAEISEGKTLLFISHRLATTRFCDSIALIDGGRIVELGTHEELMDLQGVYYNMFITQKKYYVEERNEAIE